MNNELRVIFPNKSCNERLARGVVSAFVVELDPTAQQLSELRTAVSEAVTNAIIHAYARENMGKVELFCTMDGREVVVSVTDYGCGIEDIKKAQEPMYTCSPETERSGMGFTVMEAFCDGIEVTSVVGKGTTVTLKKMFL